MENITNPIGFCHFELGFCHSHMKDPCQVPNLTQAFPQEVTEVSSRPDSELWARFEFLTPTLAPLLRPHLPVMVGSLWELS